MTLFHTGEILVATPMETTTGLLNSDTSSSCSEVNSFSDKKFWYRWLKIRPWLYEKKKSKMYCKECIKNGKTNSLTIGCTNYCTCTVSCHESNNDHINFVTCIKHSANMQVALNNVFTKEDEAVIKLIDTVVWLAKENMPLSKFESLVDQLVSIQVQGLEFLDNVQIKSTIRVIIQQTSY